MNGSPATGTNDLGWPAAIAFNRVASPPAKSARGNMGIVGSLLGNDLGTLKVKMKPHFGQTGFSHDCAQPRLLVRVEHEKPASPGANQLAPDRAIAHAEIIPGIDVVIRHAGGSPPLDLPVLIEQPGEAGQVAGLQRRLGLEPELLD